MKIEVTDLELRIIKIALITRYYYYMIKCSNANRNEERENLTLVASMYKDLYDALEKC